MKSFKSVTCKCERCNKPFKAYAEMDRPLCKACKDVLAEEQLESMTGQSVPKTMTRTPDDAVANRMRKTDIHLNIAMAEFRAAEERENAAAQTPKCKDCGEEFTITVGEKEWYESRNLCVPVRCPACRRKRRMQFHEKN